MFRENATRRMELDEAAYHQAIGQFGAVHGIVNNSAGNFISPTERLSYKAMDVVVDIVLRGTYYFTLALGKYWIENNIKGTVLNISTTYARDTADITDRQNIQYHWIDVRDVPAIWELLESNGMQTTEACGDVPRVVLGSPVAGIARDSVQFVDVATRASQLGSTTPGYPPQLLGRIGDPFMRGRDPRPADPRRPGYEGMGLGLFIAKTLLERTGAELSFANGTDPFLTMSERPNRSGAIVEAIWHSADLLVADSGGLGENLPITG